MLDLFLELSDLIIFILTFHPAQVDTPLDLSVIFITLLDSVLLLGNPEC